jgi:hypothetical protein
MAETNRPIEHEKDLCTDSAYNRYGSSSSVQLDMAKYDVEVKKCIDAYLLDFVSPGKLLSAMAGQGERELGLVAWGFIVIPPALLWIIAWALGQIVFWVTAGFRR